MILEKAGPTNSQGWLNTAIRCPGERTNSHHKCKEVHHRWALPTKLPFPVVTWENHKVERTQTGVNTSSGLPDGPKACLEQLHYWKHSWALSGLDFEKKWDTKMPEVWNNFVDRWVQHKGKRRNWFLAQAYGSPSKFKLKSAGPAASTRWSWGKPGNALHC